MHYYKTGNLLVLKLDWNQNKNAPASGENGHHRAVVMYRDRQMLTKLSLIIQILKATITPAPHPTYFPPHLVIPLSFFLSDEAHFTFATCSSHGWEETKAFNLQVDATKTIKYISPIFVISGITVWFARSSCRCPSF